MRDADGRRSWPTIVDVEDVIPELGPHDARPFADRRCIHPVLKGLYEAAGRHVPETAARTGPRIALCRGIVRLAPRNVRECRARVQRVDDRLDGAVRLQGIGWIGVFIYPDQDMTDINLCCPTVVQLTDERVDHAILHQPRTGDLGSIPVHVIAQRGGRV